MRCMRCKTLGLGKLTLPRYRAGRREKGEDPERRQKRNWRVPSDSDSDWRRKKYSDDTVLTVYGVVDKVSGTDGKGGPPV